MDREAKIRFLKDHMIPRLDSEVEELSTRSSDVNHIERVETILAEAYLEEAPGTIWSLVKLLLVLLLLDGLFPMPPEIYGPIVSIVGTWILLVEGNIHDRFTIATRSDQIVQSITSGPTRLDENKARKMAKNTVVTNIALIWLTCGFCIQVLVAIFLPSGELVPLNLFPI